MTDNTISYAVSPLGLRIFHGFRNQTLTDDSYRTTLGQTFMPGTPYMLAPLGLSAYIPGVLVGENDPNVLNEFAIIAYPSQEVWSHIMNETLRGRVYNATHGGVYDLQRSGASFPVALKHLPETAVDPYYLYDNPTDWQLGVTRVFVGAPANDGVSATDFRKGVRKSIQEIVAKENQIDQCVVMVADTYVVIWIHSGSSLDPSLPRQGFPSSTIRSIASMDASRIICRDEPPVVSLNQTMAMNFIFLREDGMFLL